VTDFTRLDWGDVPTWVSASISLLALMAATAAAVGAFRLYSVERANKQRAEAEIAQRAVEQRRTQAAQVACWMGSVHDRAGRGSVLVVNLRNASELPVYDVMIEVTANTSEPTLVTLPVLPPGATPVERPVPGPADVHGQPNPCSVTMRFRDSAGVVWRRGQDGTLTEPGGSEP
jgi:hypothetical protein